MAEGSGRPCARYRLKEKYTITERTAVVTEFRVHVSKIAKGTRGRISMQGLSDIIDDTLNGFGGWSDLDDPLFISVYHQRLDPNTLSNLLVCELGYESRRIHLRSIRVLDAFLQILTLDPPDWLGKILREDSQ